MAELLGDTDFATGFPPVHAFLWRKGLMTDLGSFGGRVSQAISVNERGEVVGSSQPSATDPLGEDFCDSGDFLAVGSVPARPAGLGRPVLRTRLSR